MGYLIVGESLAGFAAALELVAMGQSAKMVDHLGDCGGLADHYLIEPNLFNPSLVKGGDFEQLLFEMLPQFGVELRTTSAWLGGWDRVWVDPVSAELVLEDDFFHERHRFQSAIFAPNGSEVRIARELGEPFFWKGVSYSAWADATAFVGKPVVVAGCGRHAFDQALLVAEFAESVTVLCEEGCATPPAAFVAPLLEYDWITVRLNSRIVATEPQADGSLGTVVFEERGKQHSLSACGLFVAHDRVVDWGVWGGETGARELVEQGKLHLAGLAAGIPYSDHAALFESGVISARQCVTGRRGERP